MELKKIIALIVFYIVAFIFSAALFAVGLNIHNQHEAVLPYNMVIKECRLGTQELIGCNDGTWIVVYDDKIIEDVYSKKPTEDLAVRAMNNYQLNATYPCICNLNPVDINLNCSLFMSCYLNLNSTIASRQAGIIFKYGSDACIAIGVLLFVSLLTLAIVMFISKKTDIFQYNKA